MYLNLSELYALYHTSKEFKKILNTPEVLKKLWLKFLGPFNVTIKTFMYFIKFMIGTIIRYEHNYKYIYDLYFTIISLYDSNKRKITSCSGRTLRSGNNSRFCENANILKNEGFAKEN
jgi:uncharacterized protein YfbU (UPF0304 family)